MTVGVLRMKDRNMPYPTITNPTLLIMRLKARLLLNGFRRSVWMTIGFILGALYALGMVVGAIAGAAIGGGMNAAFTGQILIAAGSVAILAWLIGPIVAFGVDSTIDPHRFNLFRSRAIKLWLA